VGADREGHRNSDHARDLPFHKIGPRTDNARCRGSSMPETPFNARFLSLKHSCHGWRASPLTRCKPVRS
jgi:hypothetical protein